MKRLIVIGAGMSGLVCGIYAQRSGFRTLMLEKAATPGGVSTRWKRKGYTFEGGIHWLIGSVEGFPLHDIWTETGALQENNPVFFKDPYYTLREGDVTLSLHRNLDATIKDLEAFSPEDRRALRRLRRHVRCFQNFHTPVLDLPGLKVRHPRGFSPLEFIKMLPAVLLTPYLMSLSAGRYLSRIRNPYVRHLLEAVVEPEINALSLVYTLSSFSVGDSGYPKGGSLTMALNMARTFRDLGGEIRYNTPAAEIVRAGDGSLRGVRTAEGFLEADAVVVSMDARTAIDKLFVPPLQDGWARGMRTHLETTQCMFIGLGFRADLSRYPRCTQLWLNRPLQAAGHTYNSLIINNYANEKGMAPEGCSTLTLILPGASYPFWKQAREEGTYALQKQAVVDAVADRLAEAFPETAGALEASDMATPLTYERYCDTHEGSYMTQWLPGARTRTAPLKYRKGIYFTGNRTSFSGGLPIAADTGRRTAQLLCRDFGAEFVSH